jgi:polyphosphate kinase 2 (PPK2 family)
LPADLVSGKIWQERFEDIKAFERYLGRNGIVVLKFFLNVSKKEQKRRFLERLDQPEKNWKFSASDVLERQHWDEYMSAYEEMIRNTSTKRAPWYVVPADHKWFTRVVVAEALVHALNKLDLSFPEVDEEKRKDLKKARIILRDEK